jgi:hypothetical protein
MMYILIIAKSVCVIIGGFCWAASSVLLFRFGHSVFRKLSPNFWNPFYSSDNAKQIGGFKVDAYHIFQGLALAFLFIAAVLPNEQLFTKLWVDMLVKWGAFSGLWIIAFPVSYGLLSPLHKYNK